MTGRISISFGCINIGFIELTFGTIAKELQNKQVIYYEMNVNKKNTMLR
jgi:hypothetical protein